MTSPQSLLPESLWHTQQMSILYFTRRQGFCNRLDNIEKALSIGGATTALTAAAGQLPAFLSDDTAKIWWGAAVAIIALYCLIAGIGKKAAKAELHRHQWEALNKEFPTPAQISNKLNEYLAKKADITDEENRRWLVDACYFDICIREGLDVGKFKQGGNPLRRLLAHFR